MANQDNKMLVNKILGEKDLTVSVPACLKGTPELNLCDELAALYTTLNVSCSSSRNDMLEIVYNQTVELAQSNSRKQELSTLRQHLTTLEEEMSTIKEEMDLSAVKKKREVNFRSDTKAKQKYYQDKLIEYLGETKEKERILVKVGFNESLKEENLKAMEAVNKQKKEELKNLRSRKAKLEEYGSSNDELKNKIRAMNEELANMGVYYNRDSMS